MIDNFLTASLQGAIAFVLVWAVCKAMPRLPAVWRAWMWRLVLLKFALTLFGGLPFILPAAPPTPVVVSPSVPEPAVIPESSFDPVIPEVSEGPVVIAEPIAEAKPYPILLLLWATGLVGMTVRIGFGFSRARRLAAQAIPNDDSDLRELLEEVRSRAGYHAPVALCTTPDLPSPAVLGLGRRTLLLPAGFRSRPSEAVQAAFAHEVAHLVRRDCEWSLLGECVRAVFWFHPLVWLALREGRAEAEIAADRLARKWTDASPRDYAASLLTFVGPSAVGIRVPQVGAGLLHSTHELTRRFEAMSLNRYSRRTLAQLSCFGALPLAVILVPLRVASASPEVQAIDVPPAPGEEKLLLPLKRTRQETERLALKEGLNSGGSIGPRQSIDAVIRLERERTWDSHVIRDVKTGWEIEVLGMSHIEPGRSQSWSLAGRPLAHLLPFGASSGIPIVGDFERQLAIRFTDPAVRSVKGFFRIDGEGETPRPLEWTNTIIVPRRMHGNMVVAVQQGFPKDARKADFVLKYDLSPVPLTSLSVRSGSVVTDPAKWDGKVFTGDGFASGKPGFGYAPRKTDSVLSFKQPGRINGTLRVTVRLRNGQERIARSISANHPEITFKQHPELADSKVRSNWMVSGARRQDIAQIRLSVATSGMIVLRDLPLHPKE